MTKRTQQQIIMIGRATLFFGLGCLIGTMVVYSLLRLVNRGHVYPDVLVGEQQLSGMAKAEAEEVLTKRMGELSVIIGHNGTEWQVPREYIHYNIEETLNQAYSLGRKIDFDDLLATLSRKRRVVSALVTIDRSAINAWLDGVAQSVEVVPVVASIKLEHSKAVITNGSDGTLLSRDELLDSIETQAEMLASQTIPIPLRPSYKKLNEQELVELQQLADKTGGKKIEVVVEDDKLVIDNERLVSFMATEPGKIGRWEESVVYNFVEMIADTYNRESQNARFEVVNGKVSEFAPGRDGLVVAVNETKDLIVQALTTFDSSELVQVKAVTTLTPPEVSTGDVNKLGIIKRIGKGESYYAHSIPGRIHNVGLTSSRISGALIPPGEEFSFNTVVGEISGATGYAPAYVIKNGRTELGDGGGVCQVSTTVFRAALAAGLPITERWAHAYRVGYYEQGSEPGIDATIFSPSKDLRFLNDTPGHILVQAINDPKTLHLIIEIYGTDDGRVSSISKVKVWGITPPPPDLYQDDPTLAFGKIRQVDWSAWGAKTTFDYKVTRNGETLIEKSFPSTYRAWQNVYLRGTKIE